MGLRRKARIWFFATALAFLSMLGAPAVQAQVQKRVALVIGNGAYQHTRALPNPKNDADAIAKMLREIGFEVGLKLDLAKSAMREEMLAFEAAVREADIALVYFAGHGMELAGENYLVPTDARLASDSDLETQAVTLRSVLNTVGNARRLKIVILDACRNNPLSESMALVTGATRSVSRGLARIEPSRGPSSMDHKGDVLVAYAARAGTVADDGPNRHSPYAEALLKHVKTPGIDVRIMFGKVRDHVLAATGHTQEPFIYGSLSGDIISLVPAKLEVRAPPASQQPNRSPPSPCYVRAQRFCSNPGNSSAIGYVACMTQFKQGCRDD